MGLFEILALIIGAAGVLGSVGSTVGTNEVNKQMNAANNAANVEQSELAYKRSLPFNQVRDMVSAGMSKPAALNKLAGGGVYSAPALTAAQDSAPQFDMAQIAERIGNIPSNVEQRNLVHEQVESVKQEIKLKQREHEMSMRERAHKLLSDKLQTIRDIYGHNVKEETDNLVKLLEQRIQEKGVKRSSLTNEDAIAALIGDSDLWKNAKAPVRDYVLEYARNNANEQRAEQSSQDTHRSANDKHEQDKQNLKRLKQDVEEWINEKDLRAKKRELESLVTDTEKVLAQNDFAMSKLVQSLDFHRDENGELVANLRASIDHETYKEWQTLGHIFGFEYLGKFLGAAKESGALLKFIK